MEQISLRDYIEKSLSKLHDKNIIVINSESAKPIKISDALKKSRNFAAQGKIPFITNCCFSSIGNEWQQIRDACYANANIKIIASKEDCAQDATNYINEDIALARTLPNITIFSPATSKQLDDCINLAAEIHGVVYIRVPQENILEYSSKKVIRGKAEIIKDEGNDFAIFFISSMYKLALGAVKLLQGQGLKGKLINAVSIKPFDEELVLAVSNQVPIIVTLENHVATGGLGGTVSEIMTQIQNKSSLAKICIDDILSVSPPHQERKDKNDAVLQSIVKSVTQAKKHETNQTPVWVINIKSNYDTFGDQEKKLADYMVKNQGNLLSMSMPELAEKSNTSKSTIIRVCKKLGYSGLKDFKIRFNETAPKIYKSVNSEILWTDPIEKIKEKVFSGSISTLKESFAVLDEKQIEKTVNTLIKAENIDIYGLGGSAPLANYLRHQLMKVGIRSQVYADTQQMHLVLYQSSTKGVAVAISCSGENKEICMAVQWAKKSHLDTIAITCAKNSSLNKLCDIKLYNTASPFIDEDKNTYGRLAQLATIDVIYAQIALRLGKEKVQELWERKHMVRGISTKKKI